MGAHRPPVTWSRCDASGGWSSLSITPTLGGQAVLSAHGGVVMVMPVSYHASHRAEPHWPPRSPRLYTCFFPGHGSCPQRAPVFGWVLVAFMGALVGVVGGSVLPSNEETRPVSPAQVQVLVCLSENHLQSVKVATANCFCLF